MRHLWAAMTGSINQLCVNVSQISMHGSDQQSAKVSFQSRDHHIERMEKVLHVWIEDQTEKNAFEWTGLWEKSLWIY